MKYRPFLSRQKGKVEKVGKGEKGEKGEKVEKVEKVGVERGR